MLRTSQSRYDPFRNLGPHRYYSYDQWIRRHCDLTQLMARLRLCRVNGGADCCDSGRTDYQAVASNSIETRKSMSRIKKKSAGDSGAVEKTTEQYLATWRAVEIFCADRVSPGVETPMMISTPMSLKTTSSFLWLTYVSKTDWIRQRK